MKNIFIIILSVVAVVISMVKLIGCETPSYVNYFWFGVIAVAVMAGGDAFVKIKTKTTKK